mmetsp:Transcript_11280/g.47149  ORF Transcript_11280/g.47149 Transcript_11280/m.47149 type:complete len:236 (+) Transcript_11280:2149-2856(+)
MGHLVDATRRVVVSRRARRGFVRPGGDVGRAGQVPVGGVARVGDSRRSGSARDVRVGDEELERADDTGPEGDAGVARGAREGIPRVRHRVRHRFLVRDAAGDAAVREIVGRPLGSGRFRPASRSHREHERHRAVRVAHGAVHSATARGGVGGVGDDGGGDDGDNRGRRRGGCPQRGAGDDAHRSASRGPRGVRRGRRRVGRAGLVLGSVQDRGERGGGPDGGRRREPLGRERRGG